MKRIFSLLICAVLTLFCSPFFGISTANPPTLAEMQNYLLGRSTEINVESEINVFDLAYARRNYSTAEITDYGTPPNTSATIFADFREEQMPYFEASDGWKNGGTFDCIWRGTNVFNSQGSLNLVIDADTVTGSNYRYSGGECYSEDYCHYGYYEVSMQPIKNDGVVSSFFTYTGPHNGDPEDEIDIEFLGKDTTKVQFNYFTDGDMEGHVYLHDLEFDAADGFHTYGFDWQPDSITWYVDGKAVHTASDNIPTTKGRIMMNAWNGIGADNWLKPFDGKTPLTARYQWVTYILLNG